MRLNSKGRFIVWIIAYLIMYLLGHAGVKYWHWTTNDLIIIYGGMIMAELRTEFARWSL